MPESFSTRFLAARSSTTAWRRTAISPSPTPATRRPMPAQTTRLLPRSAVRSRETWELLRPSSRYWRSGVMDVDAMSLGRPQASTCS